MKILFVSANPVRDLSLDDEYRAIEQAIQSSPYSESIELKAKLACRISDFMNALNQEQPDILHFAGHGAGERGLVFANPHSETKLTINEGEENEEHIGVDLVSAENLHSIFKTADSNLKLVFLNACLSLTQAEEIAREIDFVIGMSDFIIDGTATILARQFYNSFASNKGIQDSFEQALTLVKIQRPDENETPTIVLKREDVEDITISMMIPQKEEKKESNGGVHINGNITGVGVVTGGEVTQNIHNNQKNITQNHTGSGDNVAGDKVINTKNNFENIDNKGTMNF